MNSRIAISISTIFLATLLHGCGGGGGGGGAAPGGGGGAFVVPAGVTDSIFRSCLEREAVAKSWRSHSDVRNITCPREDNGSSYGAGMVSLAGVQAFSNLESISVEGSGNLAQGRLDDLSPLRGLGRLHTIEMYSSDLRSLESIRGMSSLSSLTLVPSSLGDIDVLASLTGLRFVELSGTNGYASQIQDLSPLSQLSNLEELRLVSFAPIQALGLGFLQGLPNLKALDISENFMSNLQGLQYLSNLESLDLSYNNFLIYFNAPQNEPIISGLTNLKYFRYAGFDGQSLAFLASMGRLEILTITRYYNLSAADLGTINTLSSLKELYLEGFANADISLLQGLSNLELLWLADGTVDSTTLAFPTTLTSLREIHMYDAFYYHYLYGDQRGDFKNTYDVFKDLPNLTELHLIQPWLVNAPAVVLNPNIRSLSVVSAYLDDLAFFQDINGIRLLDLSNNPFTELDPLATMPDLAGLILNDAQITCGELDEFRAAAPTVGITTNLSCP